MKGDDEFKIIAIGRGCQRKVNADKLHDQGAMVFVHSTLARRLIQKSIPPCAARLHRKRKLRLIMVRDLLVAGKRSQRGRRIIHDQTGDIVLHGQRQRGEAERERGERVGEREGGHRRPGES